MIVGIVGHEASKFTAETEARARAYIRRVLSHKSTTGAVSGACPLGGIDIWTREEAHALGVPFTEYPPRVNNWSHGYKPRNLQIATTSDAVVCIAVRVLPESYTGMRFPAGCYHCGTPPDHHIKGGGCWTLKQAAKLGKPTHLEIIR